MLNGQDVFLPHLANEEADFVQLADRSVVCEKVSIPMHTSILARESRVLAQLFSSLEESGSGSRQLGEIFAGERLKTVLLTLYLLYNCNKAAIKAAVQHGVRSKDPKHPGFLSSASNDAGMWQSAIALAHKLDARRLLDETESLILNDIGVLGNIKDHLSWLQFSSATPTFSSLRASVLRATSAAINSKTYDTVNRRSNATALAEVFELPTAWEDLDKQSLVMLIEALTFNMWESKHHPTKNIEDVYREWSAPGGLFKRAAKAIATLNGGGFGRGGFFDHDGIFPGGAGRGRGAGAGAPIIAGANVWQPQPGLLQLVGVAGVNDDGPPGLINSDGEEELPLVHSDGSDFEDADGPDGFGPLHQFVEMQIAEDWEEEWQAGVAGGDENNNDNDVAHGVGGGGGGNGQ